MSRLLKEIAPHNAPGPRAITRTPCLVCGDAGEGMDCCPCGALHALPAASGQGAGVVVPLPVMSR